MNSDIPNIGNPAKRALESEGIITLKQLSEYTAKELLALHGFGPKALRIISEVMKEKGLSFKDKQ